MIYPDTIPLWAVVFGIPIIYTTWFMLATKERRMNNYVIRNRRSIR